MPEVYVTQGMLVLKKREKGKRNPHNSVKIGFVTGALESALKHESGIIKKELALDLTSPSSSSASSLPCSLSSSVSLARSVSAFSEYDDLSEVEEEEEPNALAFFLPLLSPSLELQLAADCARLCAGEPSSELRPESPEAWMARGGDC